MKNYLIIITSLFFCSQESTSLGPESGPLQVGCYDSGSDCRYPWRPWQNCHFRKQQKGVCWDITRPCVTKNDCRFPEECKLYNYMRTKYCYTDPALVAYARSGSGNQRQSCQIDKDCHYAGSIDMGYECFQERCRNFWTDNKCDHDWECTNGYVCRFNNIFWKR